MFKDMFNQFERIPASERQTDRQTDRYPAMAYSALCIASRGRNGRFRPIYRCISQTVRNMAIFFTARRVCIPRTMTLQDVCLSVTRRYCV